MTGEYVLPSEAPDLGPNAVPDRIIIDGKGYGWREWDEHPGMWSMVPQNPDNSPVPRPLRYFVPAELLGEVVDWLGAPDWSGPQLPRGLARRIAAALTGSSEPPVASTRGLPKKANP